MKKYKVTLTEDERQQLQELIAAGKGSAQKLAHARILLKADAARGGPAWSDCRIAEAVEHRPVDGSGAKSAGPNCTMSTPLTDKRASKLSKASLFSIIMATTASSRSMRYSLCSLRSLRRTSSALYMSSYPMTTSVLIRVSFLVVLG